MKVVILAGGYGTRLSEETQVIPKPLVEIGEMPILWHIMKIYSSYGLNDFVILCGYKGYLIKRFFLEFGNRINDFTIDLSNGSIEVHKNNMDAWRVTLVDTGKDVMTGGRIRRAREAIGDETFCLTYGDGVGNVNIKELLAFHREQGCLATVTAVAQPGRFGTLDLSSHPTRVSGFREKAKVDGNVINGGYFVLEPDVFDLIEGDATVWEQEPVTSLAKAEQLAVYRHTGYWQNMDTLRDRHVLEDEWRSPTPGWKVW